MVSVLDSGAVGPWFKSRQRRCRVTVLGKLFTPTVLVSSEDEEEENKEDGSCVKHAE